MENGINGGEEWSKLFDTLCVERGHFDERTLAARYCELTNDRRGNAYETALKNMGNWRQGLHTPSRRNFRILTTILEVEGEIAARWTHLHELALRRRRSIEQESNGIVADSENEARLPLVRSAFGGKRVALTATAVIGFLILAAGATLFGGYTQRNATAAAVVDGSAPPAIDMTGQRIPWREHSVVKVGQSVVIHGARSRCGEQPPSWDVVLPQLPPLSIGVWSDGGVGYRVSRSCGGPTPARAIVFTATSPGTDRFYLYEDPVKIVVEK